ncbi:UDP-N-acetylglucosamine 2-epimerase (non-hydrolyzing) [Patescibacteria group bacterium]|nr:UDP-N-acetylglucosamine 2-epimerase (non-hydrolyzing) [Patescibacteria group bacterium]MBU4162009.1 UDP-N-acetylglucosamine 2-epimerase (non-hydrolyzing) [Patescibacteria group bacterium]
MKKFKLITLLGIRPDYIRMFKVIDLLDKSDVDHILVHSGQHYDPELFGNFLKELEIRKPDIDFGIGLTLKEKGISNHAYQVSLLNEKVFDLIEKEKPDAIMYLGDTNTVLSSITVARCGVPIIHLEAGGRSFDWRMPEEKNRIVIDGLADAMYSYLERYKELLLTRGIESFRVKVIGNIIVDAIEGFASKIDKSKILEELKIEEREFIVVTLHREENIADKNILENKISDIIKLGEEKKLPVVFPIMPRTEMALRNFGLENVLNSDYLIKTKPLGFFDFSKLERTARLIVTDSGTVQEDGLIFGTPCVVARRATERPETIWAGATILEGIEGKDKLYNKIKEGFELKIDWDRTILNPEGGSPSQRVFDDLVEKIENNYFKKSRNLEMIRDDWRVKQAYNL